MDELSEIADLRRLIELQARELEEQRALLTEMVRVGARQQEQLDGFNEIALQTTKSLAFLRQQVPFMAKARLN